MLCMGCTLCEIYILYCVHVWWVCLSLCVYSCAFLMYTFTYVCAHVVMFVSVWKVDGEMSKCVWVPIHLCKDTGLDLLSLEPSMNERRQLCRLWDQRGKFKILTYGSVVALLLPSLGASRHCAIWKLKVSSTFRFFSFFLCEKIGTPNENHPIKPGWLVQHENNHLFISFI